MITKDTKISKLLESYPETLDILLNASSHFNKLKNKVLRKTLASRVNVEHAASIAGIDLTKLLRDLNKAVNLSSPPQAFSESEAEENVQAEPFETDFLQSLKDKNITALDVRPIIESGQDPFTDIMSKVKTLKEDEVFLLINSFEPIPLYSVMERKKYDHVTIKKPDEFNVYFIKKEEISAGQKSLDEKAEDSNITNEPEELIELDVRELEPPEPMLRVLEMLTKMSDNSVLLVHHQRDPLMLYEKLEERGFQGAAHKIEENYYKVIITKKKS